MILWDWARHLAAMWRYSWLICSFIGSNSNNDCSLYVLNMFAMLHIFNLHCCAYLNDVPDVSIFIMLSR